ncbi:stage 0 sporulation family protein [bacterium]|nr:stage 0 sporulation family protein [bacterium]
MPVVVGVEIRKTKEVLYFNPRDLDLAVGNKVLVDTENGIEWGEVVELEKILEKKKGEIKDIARKANNYDLKKIEENIRKEKEAFKICLQKVDDRELEMKLTSVEYTFDRNKLFVYYTAEGRIDFRELIKDLGYLLKSRIQMVQIGVRDEAKMLGGFGSCGRVLCCKSFLQDFKPVGIEMAKEQSLSLNPNKISGACGRLMCCLTYEYKTYKEAKKKLPKVGSKVKTDNEEGIVKEVNIFTEEITIDCGKGVVKKIPANKIHAGILNRLKLSKNK